MKTIEQELGQVVQHLMLYSSFTRNLGLLNGKMGFILFFFKYAKFTKKRLYKIFAEELIKEIYKDISQNEPIDFENGLCGIAWGFSYLIQNKFIEANEDEVLKELDIKILEKDVRQITDYSLETGLKGIAYYVISRYNHRKGEHPLIHYKYIKELVESLTRNEGKDKEIELLVNKLKEVESSKERNMELPLLDNLIDNVKFSKKKLFKTNREDGIARNGYTGIAFKLIKTLQHEKKSIYI